MRASRSIVVALPLVSSMLAAPAEAQDVAAAKELFTQGLAAMEAGNFEKGCPQIEGSYKIDPRPGTLFTLAECESKRGRLAAAVARYDDYLSLYARMTPEQQQKQGERKKIAESQKTALRPQVATLTLLLPVDAPRGTLVTRDGAAIVEAALGTALPVDPGEHVLTTEAPGGGVVDVRITLGKGEKKQITLPVKVTSLGPPGQLGDMPPAPPKPSPGTEATHGPSGQRIGAYIAGGVGAAGLILGGVMGGWALTKKSDIKQNCNFPDDPKGCTTTGIEEVSAARTMGTVSTIGFSVGAAGVITAVVLLLTEPKHVASARGVRVGVLSRGRAGGTLSLEGAW